MTKFRILRAASLVICAVVFSMLLRDLDTLAHAEEVTTSQAEVDIRDFSFVPRTLTVAPGTTVVCVNDDEAPHTIITADKSIRSDALDTGDRFAKRFDVPGSYPYRCSLHPQMTGTIIVR